MYDLPRFILDTHESAYKGDKVLTAKVHGTIA
jgi:hypothetical protein